ncbi:hypothetical protein AGMMS49592_2270 [Endomicrobiia bacterium]|nr:hypothetical protein AGMMS49592_2270 [Endomicrobiia bacterium]GHT54241.1 hypothetical protein AGMMS50233_01880 [Endomicrobiia bacterium]
MTANSLFPKIRVDVLIKHAMNEWWSKYDISKNLAYTPSIARPIFPIKSSLKAVETAFTIQNQSL